MRLVALSFLLAACNMAGEASLRGGDDPPDAGVVVDGAGPAMYDRGMGVPASPEADDGLDPDSVTSPGGVPSETASCFEDDAEAAPAFFTCAELATRCPSLRSCCVGDSTCCSTITNGPLPAGSITFADCADGDAVACLEGAGWDAEAFGLPLPAIRGGGLMPMGDDSYDSGVVIGSAVDVTAHAVTIEADFAPPSSCDGGCLDAVGIGFTALPTIGDATHVQVLAGLIYSGARSTMTLLRGEMAIDSWSVEGIERWELRVRPDGIEVARDGTVLDSYPEPLSASEARAVIWGRNHNRPADSPYGARLTGLELTTQLCDVPSAWPVREPLLVRNARSEVWAPDTIRAPSIATSPTGTTLVAFAVDGSLLVAELTDAGELRLDTPVHESVIVRGEGVSYADPELVWDATTGGFLLYYTIQRGSSSSIGRASGGANGSSWGASGEILAPKSGFIALEQPALLRHEYSGLWIMIVRATDTTGVPQLVAFVSSNAVDWGLVESDLGSITRRGDSSRTGFDAHALGHPSLVVSNGAWQLYYAGRNGTRWGIGLMASDDLVHWRDLGEVLAGDGNGFDRLGASAPDVEVAAEVVSMVYEAHDGVRSSIGLASRRATAMGSR